jgi:hypothetical protein
MGKTKERNQIYNIGNRIKEKAGIGDLRMAEKMRQKWQMPISETSAEYPDLTRLGLPSCPKPRKRPVYKPLHVQIAIPSLCNFLYSGSSPSRLLTPSLDQVRFPESKH